MKAVIFHSYVTVYWRVINSAIFSYAPDDVSLPEARKLESSPPALRSPRH